MECKLNLIEMHKGKSQEGGGQNIDYKIVIVEINKSWMIKVSINPSSPSFGSPSILYDTNI